MDIEAASGAFGAGVAATRYFLCTPAGAPVRDIPADSLRGFALPAGLALYCRTGSGQRQVYAITSGGRALYRKDCGRITANPEDY